MKVKSVTPEEVTEAVLPDTTPIMDTSAVPAPSSKKRKQRILPPLKSEETLCCERYKYMLEDLLRRGLKAGCTRLSIEVNLPSRSPVPHKHLSAQFTAVVPTYAKFCVTEGKIDSGFFYRVRSMGKKEEALAAIEELRGTLPRRHRLQIMGMTADELMVDGVELLSWDVGRS